MAEHSLFPQELVEENLRFYSNKWTQDEVQSPKRHGSDFLLVPARRRHSNSFALIRIGARCFAIRSRHFLFGQIPPGCPQPFRFRQRKLVGTVPVGAPLSQGPGKQRGCGNAAAGTDETD
jgi:hypothetical protein